MNFEIEDFSELDFSNENASMLILVWLSIMCWSHSVMMQPLEIDQHTALMNVYDHLGSLKPTHLSTRFDCPLSLSMQWVDLPSIQYVVELY
jgi:hypothetical protein